MITQRKVKNIEPVTVTPWFDNGRKGKVVNLCYCRTQGRPHVPEWHLKSLSNDTPAKYVDLTQIRPLAGLRRTLGLIPGDTKPSRLIVTLPSQPLCHHIITMTISKQYHHQTMFAINHSFIGNLSVLSLNALLIRCTIAFINTKCLDDTICMPTRVIHLSICILKRDTRKGKGRKI
jgi:hypothetical protein